MNGDEDIEEEKAYWGKSYGGKGGRPFGKVAGIDGNDTRIDGMMLIGGHEVGTIQMRVNGKWQSKFGRGNPYNNNPKRLILAENEWISSVTIQNPTSHVNRLHFVTNLAHTITAGFGVDGGGPKNHEEQMAWESQKNKFTEPKEDNRMLLNMRGRYSDCLDQIQFEWGPAPKNISTPVWGQVFGGSGGKEVHELGTNATNNTIMGVHLWGDKGLDAIAFLVNKNWKNHNGIIGKGAGVTLYCKTKDEYIQSITVRYGDLIDNIKITTNKNRTIQVGGDGGDHEYTEGGANKRLMDVRGRRGDQVDQLQFKWLDV
eukprot:324085_1